MTLRTSDPESGEDSGHCAEILLNGLKRSRIGVSGSGAEDHAVMVAGMAKMGRSRRGTAHRIDRNTLTFTKVVDNIAEMKKKARESTPPDCTSAAIRSVTVASVVGLFLGCPGISPQHGRRSVGF